jgi:nucleoside 2-deoxyribosyltransferase
MNLLKTRTIYIAAPLPLLSFARQLASVAKMQGLTVVSTWHTLDVTVEDDNRALAAKDATLGDTCFAEIDRAAAVLLVYGEATTRHGSIAEAGYAHGQRKPVLLYPFDAGDGPGVVPTALFYGRGFTHATTQKALLDAMSNLAAHGAP